jgi:hypothetical protein
MVVKSKNVLKYIKFRGGRSKKTKQAETKIVEHDEVIQPTSDEINSRQDDQCSVRKEEGDVDPFFHESCLKIGENVHTTCMAIGQQTTPNDDSVEQGQEVAPSEIKGDHIEHDEKAIPVVENKKTEDLDVFHGTCMTIGETVHKHIEHDEIPVVKNKEAKEEEEEEDLGVFHRTYLNIGQRMHKVFSLGKGKGQTIPVADGDGTKKVEAKAPPVERQLEEVKGDNHVERDGKTDENVQDVVVSNEKEEDSGVFHSTCMIIGEKMHNVFNCT